MKSSQPSLKYELLFCLFAAIAVISIYSQVITHDFINYDDDTYITNNQYVQKGLASEGLRWAFSFQNKGQTYWHPLAWLSHMADVSLFGLAPGYHLLVNMVWHIFNTWLLFFLLSRMTGMFWLSAFAAAFFAVHPINVEVVAWISQRKSLVSTFFCFLSISAYVFYAKSPDWKKYLLLVGVFISGLMAKPMLITLPFIFLLLDYWPLQRITFAPATGTDGQKTLRNEYGYLKIFYCLLEKIPLALISLLTTYLVTKSFPATKYVSFEQIPLSLRGENLLVSYVSYIGKLLWPVNLAVLYPFPKSLPLAAVIASLLLLISLTLIIVIYLRGHKPVTVGWLWFLGTLVPVSGFVQAGIWPAMADRWVYIPAVGIFLILSWFICTFTSRREKNQIWSMGFLLCLVIVLGTISWRQTRYWQDSVSLFRHTAEVTNDNVIAYTNLGQAYWSGGLFPEALREYQEAARIYPYSARIHYSIGRVLADMKNCQEAGNAFKRAIGLNPNYAPASYNGLGSCYAENGLYQQARWAFEQTLRFNPNDTEAKNNLMTIHTLTRGSK